MLIARASEQAIALPAISHSEAGRINAASYGRGFRRALRLAGSKLYPAIISAVRQAAHPQASRLTFLINRLPANDGIVCKGISFSLKLR